MTNQNHPFHLVTTSPWPIIISFSLMNNLIMMISWFQKNNYFISLTIPCTLICMYQWWRDVTRESTHQGCHTLMVYKGMRLGMLLFILSEILFFMSFFWAYFHSSLSPSVDIGLSWPPIGITPFNPYDIPLLNSIILISSGLTVTWSHHSMLNNIFSESKFSLLLTIILGIYFTFLQIYEYYESSFTISDSVYGSTFFMSTGFHGLHVIIGTLFLLTCFFRMNMLHFSSFHHFGFEAASWYWHFVDIVWLFVYISIYWWKY